MREFLSGSNSFISGDFFIFEHFEPLGGSTYIIRKYVDVFFSRFCVFLVLLRWYRVCKMIILGAYLHASVQESLSHKFKIFYNAKEHIIPAFGRIFRTRHL